MPPSCLHHPAYRDYRDTRHAASLLLHRFATTRRR
jgi:hypothetical protein